MKAITWAWLSAVKDDLQAIDEIIHNENLTNIVAFHSQQAIEKSFKALLEEREGVVPKIHSLETLLPKVSRHLSIEGADFELFEDLDKLYTDARYPGNFGLLPNGKPTLAEAEAFRKLAVLIYTEVNNILK
jgi:HEPN domain-containing protein